MDLQEGHTALHEVPGMEDKLPRYTTLQEFHARAEVSFLVDVMIGRPGKSALKQLRTKAQVAMDSPGMEPGEACAHFTSRNGRRRSRYVKLSLTVICGSLLPLGPVTGRGPNNYKCQAAELLHKSLTAAVVHRKDGLLGARSQKSLFSQRGRHLKEVISKGQWLVSSRLYRHSFSLHDLPPPFPSMHVISRQCTVLGLTRRLGHRKHSAVRRGALGGF